MSNKRNLLNELDRLINEGEILAVRLRSQETPKLIYGKFTITDQWLMRARNFIQATGDFKALRSYNEMGVFDIDSDTSDKGCFEYTFKIVNARKQFLIDFRTTLSL